MHEIVNHLTGSILLYSCFHVLVSCNYIALPSSAYSGFVSFANLLGSLLIRKSSKFPSFYVLVLDILHQFRNSCSPFMRLLPFSGPRRVLFSIHYKSSDFCIANKII